MGREALIGKVGRARTPLSPEGMVWVDGALWNATIEGEAVAAGARVEVVAIDGLQLRVRPALVDQPLESEEPVLSSGAVRTSAQ